MRSVGSGLALVLVLSGSAAQAEIVGLWRFEGAVNDTVADDSGHGNSAVLLQGAGIGSDVLAPCVLVDEIACTPNAGTLDLQGGQAAVIADAPELRPTQFTVEAWIKPEPGAWVVVGKQFGSECCWNSFQIELRQSSGGRLAFNLADPWGGVRILVADAIPPTGVWSHVAATWDGLTMRLYLDGVMVGSLPYGGAIGYDDNPILIGADDDGNGVPGCCYFVGEIDEVRLSDRALTPDEFLRACLPSDCEVAAESTSWGRLKTTYR